MEYENYTFPEVVEHLAEQAGMELPKEEQTSEQQAMADYRATLREMNKDAANYFFKLLHHEHGKRGYEYFKSRQITDETILKFGLGFADIYRDDLYRFLKQKGYQDEVLKDSGLVEVDSQGAHDKFWNRVMFPIVDMNGKVIGFGGRVMGDGEPKYLNSRETLLFEKKKNLYGLHFARRSKRDGFLLCEGYMDVISLHQAGFDNAVASLGTAYTIDQARLLKRYRNRVFLAYDSDAAGQKAALRAIEICRNADLSARVISMEPYKDPDEFIKNLGAEEYEKRIANSISSVMYEIQVLAGQFHLNDPEDKTNFGREAAKRLSYIKDKLERENYVTAVAEQYHFQERSLLQQVNQIGEQTFEEQRFKDLEEESKKSHQRIVKDEKEAPILQEKLLLTWVANYPVLWEKIREHITVQEFSEGLTRQIAEQFEKQFQQTNTVNPAEVIDSFPDLSLHSKISAILNEEVQYEGSEQEDEEMRRQFAQNAITETVRRFKQESIDRQMKEVAQQSIPKKEQSQRFMELMKETQALENLYITLDNG